MAKNLLKVLESLDAGTIIENSQTGETNTVERELDAIEGHNDLAEPAVLDGDKIYFLNEFGGKYMLADPVYIVKK